MFKDGNKQEVANYRPISLLSTVSKLLEKLIFNKLYPLVSPLFIRITAWISFKKVSANESN